MTDFLGRLALLCFRRRGVVTALWVALLVTTGIAASAAGSPPNSPLTVPGTGSQHAYDLIAQRFPGSTAQGATARVVFRAAPGTPITSEADRAIVAGVIAELKTGSPQVASVSDPFAAGTVSKDSSITYSRVSYTTTATELTTATTDALQHAADTGRAAGLDVQIGGDALTPVPKAGSAEVIGLLVTAIVLFLTFGSLIAAGMPLLTALIGVGVGITSITALSKTLDLSATTSILALMIGLAVGIDYALFIVSRYRAELAAGHDREAAAGRAGAAAGSSVVFAGTTVVIALAGLAVVGIPNLTKMGLAAAGTVAVAVLIALTLVPALLGFAKSMVLPRRIRRAAKAGTTTPAPGKAGLATRWARLLVARPVPVLVAGVAALLGAALPATGLRMALPDDGHLPADTTQRRAYDLLTEGFGPGFNGPLLVVVDAARAADRRSAAAAVGKEISALGDVASVGPAAFNPAGDTAQLTVIPASGPNDVATRDLVTAIRALKTPGGAGSAVEVEVSGITAMNIDISQRLSDALIPYLALVVGLAVLLLAAVFRSLLIPLTAAAGFLLSVLAALGAVVAVFQWGWLSDVTGVAQTGPIMSTMPIFMIGVVFGLAMDYEVFLVSRMREAYAAGADPRDAVVSGFGHSARVVAAGAAIMTSVFGGFVGSTQPMIKMLGFGLGVAVLFDAFVVRLVIVPASLALLGRAAWWMPDRLARALPDIGTGGKAAATPEPVRSEHAAGLL